MAVDEQRTVNHQWQWSYTQFYNCNNLTKVSFPIGVANIGQLAFSDCSNLTSIGLSDGLISIKEEAFRYCHKLTTVSIPASVASIGKNAFYDCNLLEAIEVAKENTSYTSIGGVLFDKAINILLQYPEGKQNVAYTIPASVKSIGADAFYKCSRLTYVTIDAIEPPELIGGNNFETNAGDILYVPKASLEAYKSSAKWRRVFAQIEEQP